MRRVDIFSSQPPPPSDTEKSAAVEKTQVIKLQAVLQEFGQLKNFELYRVGKAGWMLHRRDMHPGAQHGLGLDLDEFMVKTSETKTEVVNRIQRWLESLHQLEPSGAGAAEAAKSVFRLSDNFARWTEDNDQETTYHLAAQAKCVGWLMNVINDELAQGYSLSEAVQTATSQLQQIAKTAVPPHFGLPVQSFNDTTYFENQAAELIRSMLSDPIENVGVTQAVGNITKAELFSVGFLSGGDAEHQLRKILNFLSRHSNWPIHFIGLSESDKGEFLLAAEQLIASFLNVDFPVKDFFHLIQLDDSPLVGEALQGIRAKLEAMLVGMNRYKLATGKFAQTQFFPTGSQDTQTDLSHHLEQDQAFITQFEQEFWQWYWLFCVATLGVEAERTNLVQAKVRAFDTEPATTRDV